MKAKALLIGSIVLSILLLAALAVRFFLAPLPDWAVRTAGVLLLVDCAVMAYSGVQLRKANRRAS